MREKEKRGKRYLKIFLKKEKGSRKGDRERVIEKEG